MKPFLFRAVVFSVSRMCAMVGALLALALGGAAVAQPLDHLEPENGPTMNLRMSRDYADAVEALALKLHPLAPCGVIVLYGGTVNATQLYKEEDGACYVETFTVGVGADAGSAKQFTKEIAPPLYDAIAGLWRRELLKVRYAADPQPLVAEATTYHFYAFDGRRTLFGLTQVVEQREPEPTLENLTQIANLLSLYAEAEATAQAAIVNDLRQRLVIQGGRK